MPRTTRFVTFDAYVPEGDPKPGDLVMRQAEVAALEDGQVLLKPIVFALDPVNRLPVSGKGMPGMPPHPLGEPIRGQAVCRVVESRNPSYATGTLVTGWVPWSELIIWPFADDWMGLTPIDETLGKPSHALGVFGISGITAYCGIVKVGEVKAGQTVLVSSAAGSVGTIVGQIARIKGARVIGMTSSKDKEEILTDRLGFDATINYRADDFAQRLAALMPGGPDIYFDCVGGAVSNAVMFQMRRPARIVECGQISTYGERDGAWKVDVQPIHANGLRFEGFHPMLFADEWPAAFAQLAAWVKDGLITPLETERTGFDALPEAFSDLFASKNVGKMVVLIPEA